MKRGGGGEEREKGEREREGGRPREKERGWVTDRQIKKQNYTMRERGGGCEAEE